MDKLENSPLLQKLNPRRKTHYSDDKNKGNSKLSLKGFRTPKANVPERELLFNRIASNKNELVNLYSTRRKVLKAYQDNSELKSENCLIQDNKSDIKFFNLQSSCNTNLENKQEMCDSECCVVQSDVDTDELFKDALNWNYSKSNSDMGIDNVSTKDNLFENIENNFTLNTVPKDKEELCTQDSNSGFNTEQKSESTQYFEKLKNNNETSSNNLIFSPEKVLRDFPNSVASLSLFYIHDEELKVKTRIETDNKKSEIAEMSLNDKNVSSVSTSSFSCTRHERKNTSNLSYSKIPDSLLCEINGTLCSSNNKFFKESNMSDSNLSNIGLNKKKTLNIQCSIIDENIHVLGNVEKVQENIDLNKSEYFTQKKLRSSSSENSCNGEKRKVLLDFLNSSGDSPPPLSERLKTPGSYKSTKNLLNKTSIPSIAISSSGSSDELEEFLDNIKKPASLNVSNISDAKKLDAKERLTQNHLSEPIIIPSKTKVKVKSNNAKLSPSVSIQKHFITPSKSVPIKRSIWKHILSSDEESNEDVFVSSVNLKKVPFHKPKSGTNEKNSLCASKSSFISSLSSDVPQSEADPEAFIFRKHFSSKKNDLLQKLYNIYNETVFNNQLPTDMKITWNSRMRKTAGFCYYKIDPSVSLGRTARIELAPKVLDAADRLRDTLIHEMCHAASWIIHGYRDGHGPLWKFWASRANQAFPDLPKVSRCHSYEISTKYVYNCTKCGGRIGRHSKSLDINKNICGRCGGRFELLVNGKSSSTSTPTGFALFVKENYKNVKKMNGQVKHAQIMRLLSAEFSAKAKIS